MINHNDSTIPVFVINLDKDKERLNAISGQMKAINRDFIRWRATSGDELDSAKFGVEPQSDGAYITGFREWSKNEAACGVSHIRLLQKIITESISWSIILEDDAILHERLPDTMFEFDVPSDAEIVLLNGRSQAGDPVYIGKSFDFGEVIGGAGTDGYLISLIGAKKILKILNPLRDPLDFQLYSHFQSIQETDRSPFYWRLPQNPSARDTLLKAYRVIPALIEHADLASAIGGQRHPRARYYCRVLLGLKLPELQNYYTFLNSVVDIQAVKTSKNKLYEYRAVDVSHLDESLLYYPPDSQVPLRPMKILRSNGVNCVRISLWVSRDSKMNIERTIHLAQQAKEEGLAVYLAMHYSDNWADPTHQSKPADWENLSFDLLCNTVYDYTKNVLEAMMSKGIVPVVVQIGNEITNGFLWASEGQSMENGGKIFSDNNIGDDRAEQWSIFARLISFATSAVRDTLFPDIPPMIMLQIDKGAEPEIATWWFDKARVYGIDFDIIGLSYYFLWHHATLNELERLTCLNTTFPDKGIFLAETSYPYRMAEGITMSPPDDNPPFTRQGQSAYVRKLLDFMRKLPNGCGICWWGAFFLNETFDHCEDLFLAQALFDERGIALDSLSEFRVTEDNN